MQKGDFFKRKGYFFSKMNAKRGFFSRGYFVGLGRKGEYFYLFEEYAEWNIIILEWNIEYYFQLGNNNLKR